jgi:hypothetical protein
MSLKRTLPPLYETGRIQHRITLSAVTESLVLDRVSPERLVAINWIFNRHIFVLYVSELSGSNVLVCLEAVLPFHSEVLAIIVLVGLCRLPFGLHLHVHLHLLLVFYSLPVGSVKILKFDILWVFHLKEGHIFMRVVAAVGICIIQIDRHLGG